MGEVTVWSPLACIKNPQIGLLFLIIYLFDVFLYMMLFFYLYFSFSTVPVPTQFCTIRIESTVNTDC